MSGLDVITLMSTLVEFDQYDLRLHEHVSMLSGVITTNAGNWFHVCWCNVLMGCAETILAGKKSG